MKFVAKMYATRNELENAIALSPGSHTIEGTARELAKLGLSARSKIFGVPCVVLGRSPRGASQQAKKPDRGVMHKFGINGRTIKPKQ